MFNVTSLLSTIQIHDKKPTIDEWEMLEEPMNGVNTLSWNPTSYKMKLLFLYSTISTLKLVKFSLALGQSYIYIDYFGQVVVIDLGTNKVTPTITQIHV
jgi:hypothetical protein